MAWALIELLDELKARVDKAVSSGGLECKAVFIGDFEQIRKENDYPIIVIAPTNTKVSAECMQWGTIDDAIIKIVYIISKLYDNNNKLYKNGDTSGALYELSTLLNYLEKKTTDGTVDLSLNGKTHNLPVPTIDFDYSQSDLIRIIITYTAKTAEYTRGAR